MGSAGNPGPENQIRQAAAQATAGRRRRRAASRRHGPLRPLMSPVTSQWLTAAELAGLPGIPSTARGVRLKAQRKGWQYRDAPSNGGKQRAYSFTDLPDAARAELARRAAATVKTPPNYAPHRKAVVPSLATAAAGGSPYSPPPGEAAGGASLKPAALDRAEARLAIVNAFDAFFACSPLGKLKATTAFAALYNAGRLDLPGAVKAVVASFSPSALRDWRKKLAIEGVAALAGAHGHRRGRGIIDSSADLQGYIVALLAAKPHVDAAQVMRGLRARFGESLLPSYRSLRRWIAAWKADNAQVFLAVRDPDKFRSKYQPAFGSASAHIIALNQLWELDSSPADVMTTSGRSALVGCIDIFSRRTTVLVAPTSRATALAAVTRKAMLAWGVPAAVKTDQGSDYISRHYTRVLADLQITHQTCRPYTPEGKPHIERFFKTLSHQFLELLPGYIGHDVRGRKEIENRKSFAGRAGDDDAETFSVDLSAVELQERIDAWLQSSYERQPHNGLGGLSPFEKAASWPGAVSRIENERALDLLLAEAPDGHGMRTVGKSGIRCAGATFIGPVLGAHVGDRVRVRFDPADMGAIFVFDSDGGFLCRAFAAERLGVGRAAAARGARYLQRRVVKDAKAAIRRLKKQHTPERIAEDIVAFAATAAGRLTAFPGPSVLHETAALDAAVIAAAGTPEPAAPTADEVAAAAAKIAELEAGFSPPAARIIAMPAANDGNDGNDGNGRPFFATDDAFVLWVRDHPDAADDGDRALAEKLLTSWALRQRLGLNDDPDNTDNGEIRKMESRPTG
ncbi:MAG TPA: hypothetical protein ENI55_04590 [Alphaproteobacteria bacterium]|nr:hypothetical protein [Alphaproteobacteria bacterium]